MLTATTPTYQHVLANLSLILLCAFCAPYFTAIAFASWILSPYTNETKHIQQHRKWRTISSSTFRPRRVLITGVGMSKGLTLARTFYRAGHKVIGADFEPYRVPVCGRFSTSIEKFYRLMKPKAQGGPQYIEQMKHIIEEEKIELWVSVSGNASVLEDGEAAEIVEKETSCKAIQFGLTPTETLHDKHSFIGTTREMGLNVPHTHLVTSEAEAMAVLYPEKPRSTRENQYILKSVGWDESVRTDMTLLPMTSRYETAQHIKAVGPTPFRPFVLQQYIAGPEYCTHSLIINGKVKAFVALPSAELLLHYNALPASSALSQAMLRYTTLYAQKMLVSGAGHFSLDFLVDDQIARIAELKIGASPNEVRDLMSVIYPIECNPRPNTAGILFAEVSEDLAETYLSVLDEHEPKGVSTGHLSEDRVIPSPNTPGYYWIGSDFITMVVIPILQFVRWKVTIWDVLENWLEFAEHLIYWHDGTFEVWDPWPAWWQYTGYWPAMFAISLWQSKWWSRCSVPLNKRYGI
ncbi:hypothetical protein BJ878DRAFT_520357 [Calycina marina]|uniref:ATP-grasp domain-containing protein n=1 Tax=Calycina marina TaxID=1763456 RepID=A0A9P7YXI4_9HELO|nr:hypothetical protein BJ878DRAFT_520357 [Calycina marina]